MPDYQNGKIYRIKHLNSDNCYIGSTTCTLEKREVEHKCSSNRSTRPLYEFIRQYGWDQFVMELVHDYPCQNAAELHQEEQRVLQLYKPSLNHNNAYGLNRERFEKYQKEYQIQNKEQLCKKHKTYYVTNRDKLMAYMIQRYHKHRDELCEPWVCECGCEVTLQSKYTHLKTRKHAKKLLNEPPPCQHWTCECGIRVHIQSKDKHLKSIRHGRRMGELDEQQKKVEDKKNFVFLEKIEILGLL